MCKALHDFKSEVLALNGDDLAKKHIAIVMHANPDPDCIGSALATRKLLEHWNPDLQYSLVYSGEISHSQNKTMVNVLNITMTHVNDIENIEEYADAFIVVDVTPERVLPKGIDALMTIDHHRADTKRSKVSDIRQLGATASILWEYFQKEEIHLKQSDDNDTTIATAMLIGIKTDTSDLVSENTTDLDFEAYKDLIGYVNRRQLSSIINYPIPPYHFDLRSQLDKEENVKELGGVFVGGIGCINPSKRDALPIMAEERARMEGIDTAFVFAIVGDTVQVSVRSNGLSVDVNGTCQKIFGKEFAGGKQGAGAASIPLPELFLNDISNESSDHLWKAVKGCVMDKIFKETS